MLRRTLIATVALAATLTLAACTTPAPAPAPTPTGDPAPEASGDGTLVIGTLLPTRADAASAARIAGVELAVREINEAGGVLGSPVVTVHRDSGDSETEGLLEASFAELLSAGADLVVGPTDDALMERLLPLTAEQQVLLAPQRGEPTEVDEEFAARVQAMDPGVRDATPALAAYDAVITAALAATLGDDDGAPRLAHFAGVLADGDLGCATLGECLHIHADGQSITYTAASGDVLLELTAAPEPSGQPDDAPDDTPDDDSGDETAD